MGTRRPGKACPVTAALVVVSALLALALFALRQAHERLASARHSEIYARHLTTRLLHELCAEDKALRVRGIMTYEEAVFNLDAIRRATSGRWWESDP